MANHTNTPDATQRRKLRRHADKQLLKDHDVLAAILNTAGALIAVLNENGEIIIFNRACEQITGYSSSEVIGRPLWEVANPPDAAGAVREFFYGLLKGEFPETHERHWSSRDGHQSLIRWNNTAIYDAAGNLRYIVATGFDITEARRAKLEIVERGAQLAERVKELRCLYGISQLSERGDLTLDEFVQGVVEIIPPAWQFPDICSACIRIGDREYRSAGFTESEVCQGMPINQGGNRVGHIQVCYSTNPAPDGDSPFLVEETRLLENISEALSRVVAEFRSHQRIDEYQERLRSLASELALTGERERRRIAQQLHNEIGHKLASIKFRLSELRKRGGEQVVSDLLGLVESTIESSRNLTFELSPPVLHELGLGAALEWLSHQLEVNYGIPCEFHDDRQPKPLNEDLRVELFQAARELLANVGKHSRASRAAVSVEVAGDHLHLLVRDNGIGFDAGPERRAGATNLGWGLFGIRERLGHLGVDVDIQSTSGQGTVVKLVASLATNERPAITRPPEAGDSRSRDAAARTSIRILLVDDQLLTRAGLRALLEQEPDLRVIAEASDGEEAVELARRHTPDVVVMDVAMPKLSGIQATAQIRKDNPDIKVIGLSMHSDGQYVLEMLRAGATGYLLKDCAQTDLAQSIRIVQANLTFLSPGLTDNVARKFTQGADASRQPTGEAAAEALADLTPREREVLKLMASGLNTKEIAQQLAISVKTIETHRQHVMEKLDDRSVAGLTRFAIRHGLIDLDE